MVDGDRCPACGTAVEGDLWCGACGLELAGAEASELRSLAGQLAETEHVLEEARRRRDRLATQLSIRQARTLNARGAPTPPAPPPAAWPKVERERAEWNVERVRNVLLWTGATLLALSALAFTAVAWTHLGPAGRASLLIFVTIVSAIAATATRSPLPATSGALTGLTIALALVDWQIARRAGAASGLSRTAWWAIGTGVVSVLSLALGRVASPVPARRAVAVLAPASAFLALASSASAAWSGALGLSVLAVVLIGADHLVGVRVGDPFVRGLLRFEATASWLVGAVVVVVAAFEPNTFGETLTPAAVMLTFAVAPALALTSRGALVSAVRTTNRVPLAMAAIAPLVGAALTLMSTAVGPIGLMTFAVLLGVLALVIAPSFGEVWCRAAQTVGGLVAMPGMVVAGVLALVAEIGPTAWLAHAWTGVMSAEALRVVNGPDTTTVRHMGWCAVGILATVAVALPFADRPRRGSRPPSNPIIVRVVAIAVLFLAVTLAPIAAGASARVACITVTAELVLALIGSAIAVGRDPDRALPWGLLAVVPAVPAVGWAAMTTTASVTVLAIVVLAASAAAWIANVPSLRAGHAALGGAAFAMLAAVSTLAAGASLPAAGFAGGVAAAAVLVFGAQVRRDAPDGMALELVGGIGILGGVLAAADSAAWTAGTLTAAVPLLLLASLRGHRTIFYGVVSAAAALGATWAWLAAAGVTVVEAYTLPAAAAALAAATLIERRDAPGHSWLDLGPAVALALGPTLVLAIARNDDVRAVLVGLAALAILLVGSARRLQAPIVLGAITLIVLGIDKLGPQAARLPRWAMLAFAGSVLLWVGTTFERRRDEVMRAARRFEQLG